MKRAILVLWIITILAIIFLGLTQRYAITASTTELPFGYKIDKLTGKVWFLKGAIGQLEMPVKKEEEKK